MEIDPNLTRTAYHECGHAVAASLLGGQVDKLKLTDPEDEYAFDDSHPMRSGEIRVVWPVAMSAAESDLGVREIKVALAGPVVEMIFDGTQVAPEFLEEWRFDWDLAVDRATHHLPKNKSVAEHLAKITFDLLGFFERDDVWAAVAALADELEAHGELDVEGIEAVLNAWPIDAK